MCIQGVLQLFEVLKISEIFNATLIFGLDYTCISHYRTFKTTLKREIMRYHFLLHHPSLTDLKI